MDAARRGVAVAGATLYVTTFPCHDCAKHLVAAGLRRIVYVEPYPKSRAEDFYPAVFHPGVEGIASGPVRVEPFVGVGPRSYMRLFTIVSTEGSRIRRKGDDGKVVDWNPSTAGLRWKTWADSFVESELVFIQTFRRALDSAGLRRVESERAGGGTDEQEGV